MATMTYYVALGFKRSDDGGEIVASDPKEARSADQAIRMAGSLQGRRGHCGAIALSRTGDPALGDFEDAVILKTVGEEKVDLAPPRLQRPKGRSGGFVTTQLVVAVTTGKTIFCPWVGPDDAFGPPQTHRRQKTERPAASLF